MASDLISRKALLKELYENINYGHYGEFMDGSKVGYTSRELDRLIESQPTVDAVEVVRCERCEFWIDEMYSTPLEGYCEIHERCTEYDEFCSHGTKMDGGDK